MNSKICNSFEEANIVAKNISFHCHVRTSVKLVEDKYAYRTLL